MDTPSSAVGGPLLWIILFGWWLVYEIRNPLRDRKGRPQPIMKRLMPLWIGMAGMLFWVAAILARSSYPISMFFLAVGLVIILWSIIYGFRRRKKR